MAPTTASPATWTLRFKFHKKTVLLHVDPLQSFSSIKVELLRALKQTHPDGDIGSGNVIPSDTSDVLFAQPIDIHDNTQGWTRIHCDRNGGEDGEKQAGKKTKSRPTYSEDSPTAAGLKDGAMIAFKFRTDGSVTEDIDEALGLDDEDDDWDVILPQFEDAGDGTT